MLLCCQRAGGAVNRWGRQVKRLSEGVSAENSSRQIRVLTVKISLRGPGIYPATKGGTAGEKPLVPVCFAGAGGLVFKLIADG